jgi:peptide-methionine (S)-S-oxide reductase
VKAEPSLDDLFRQAVEAIDAGDLATLNGLLADYPQLAQERLTRPGRWLHDQVGNALSGFFKNPYLLWFVAEDPVRNRRLPRNIVDITNAIIDAARSSGAKNLQEQLDYALCLVAWSGVAADFGVQLQLIDAFIDAGAAPARNANNALVNSHFAAAERILERGGEATLAAALCLGRWEDVERLAPEANPEQRQFAFILAALTGRAEGVRRALDLGAGINQRTKELYSHATALHHAVCSGSLDTVKVLVDAGADTRAKDKVYGGTPLGWARHYVGEARDDESRARYAAIAAYLKERGNDD